MTTQQPEAQERKFWKRLCALNRFSFFYMGGGVARASDKSGNWIEVHSAQEIVDDAECEVSALTARITELESQLAQRFGAADMATASAQGFRDGVASLTAQAADSVQEDADRLDFLIEQRAYVVSDPDACPGHWLRWARPDGSTWVQVDEHPTPRAAIDAARKQ